MRLNRYSFVVVIGTILAFGVSAFAADFTLSKSEKKRYKSEGILSVTTKTGGPVRIRVDGQDYGVAGAGTEKIFLLPGEHTVEAIAADGTVRTFDVQISRSFRTCLCVRTTEETITKPCPYRFHLEGPGRVKEGDPVTFTAVPDVTSPVPLRYGWRVDPGDVRITSGLGTPSITVDSTGMGNRTIDAELDVNDDVYDGRCRQIISVPAEIIPDRKPEPPKPYICDSFEPGNRDQDKARFDNCVIQVQNTPDAQMYIYIYPGTDKVSMQRFTYERTSKFYLDYLVRTRGFDPSRVKLAKGSSRTKTFVVIWVVPPGADVPPVN